MFDLAIAETSTGTQYSIELLTSAEYIKRAKQNGTWNTMSTNYNDDYADGLTSTIEDNRASIMQDFNDRNGLLALDAQPALKNPEGVTVYQERATGPYEVATFDDIVDFQDWANALEHLDEEVAEQFVDETRYATADRTAEHYYTAFTALLAAGPYTDAAYDRGDPKRSDYTERSAA